MKKHWKGLLALLLTIVGIVFVRGPRMPFMSTVDAPEGSEDSRRNIRRRRKVAATQYS